MRILAFLSQLYKPTSYDQMANSSPDLPPSPPNSVPTAPTSPHRFVTGSAPTSPCRSLPKEDNLEAMLYTRPADIQVWGGYRLDLMLEPVSEDLICGLCSGVAKESVQTIHCGAVFCKSCMEQAFVRAKPQRRKKMSSPGLSGGKSHSADHLALLKIECPKEGCSVYLAADGQFPDTRHQNQVARLRVACPLLQSRSCPWMGSIADLVNSHISECELARVPCPVGCGLNELRGQIEWHLRERCGKRLVACEYCGQNIESRLLNEHHASTNCPEYPVPCPNRCTNGDRRHVLPRSELADHVANTCPLEALQCPYLIHGCAELPLRQDMQAHLNNSVSTHLDMARNYCETRFEKYQRSQEEHATSIEWVRNKLLESTNRMNDNLRELNVKLDDKFEGFEKRLTELSGAVGKCKDKLNINSEEINIKGEGEGTGIGTSKPEELEALHEEVQKVNEENKRLKTALSNYSKRVSLIEELNVWGNYTWVIKSVSEKLKLKQFLYSNPFYTSPSGYRVCVSIALNGFGPGEDSHIGLGLFMMKGRNDPYLTWPFAGTRKYILINHLQGGKHYYWNNSDSSDNAFQRPPEERGETGHGCPQFISHKELFHQTEEVQYLKDDTLIIRIIVKPNE